MKLRYGFQTEAEKLALEIRRKARVAIDEPVDVIAVARRYGASVVALQELHGNGARPESIRHFLRVEPDAFSALTVVENDKAMIIYNEAHTSGRIANSVAHETSHIALKHKRVSGFVVGCRSWDANEEGEANWLGGCILVPRDSAAWVVARSMSVTDAADHFGVSEQLMRMRINMTGVAKIAARRRKA